MFRSAFFQYLHLILLPVYFIIHHYYVNFRGVSETDAAVLLLIHLGVIACLIFFTQLIIRDLSKSIFLSTVIMLFLLFFGLAKDFAFQRLQLPLAAQYLMILGLFVLFLWLLYSRALNRKPLENKLHIFLTVLFALWIAFEFFNAIPVYKKATTHFNPVSYTPSGLAHKPSIYLLVLDEYPRKDALKKIFSFDNSPFLKELQARGFVIDSQSRSNYELTHISMASTLSFDYLPIVGAPKNDDYGIAASRLNNSILWDMLEQEGYSITNYSIFEINNQKARKNSYSRNYNIEYFDRTLPGRIVKDFPELFSLAEEAKIAREEIQHHRDRSYNLQTIRSISTHIPKTRPEFVYTHLMMPHPPFHMDSLGRVLNTNENKGDFVSYTIYTNKVVLRAIDHLQRLPGEKIIYVMGDHGFRSDHTPRELFFDNLSAIYSTSGFRMMPGTTNVNQFRNVINHALSQKLSKVKDSTIYLTYGTGHFNF